MLRGRANTTISPRKVLSYVYPNDTAGYVPTWFTHNSEFVTILAVLGPHKMWICGCPTTGHQNPGGIHSTRDARGLHSIRHFEGQFLQDIGYTSAICFCFLIIVKCAYKYDEQASYDLQLFPHHTCVTYSDVYWIAKRRRQVKWSASRVSISLSHFLLILSLNHLPVIWGTTLDLLDQNLQATGEALGVWGFGFASRRQLFIGR